MYLRFVFHSTVLGEWWPRMRQTGDHLMHRIAVVKFLFLFLFF
jgi:hypothetical protein